MYNLFATFVTLVTLLTATKTEAMGYGGHGKYNTPPLVSSKYIDDNIPEIMPSIYSYIHNHNHPPSALYKGSPAPYTMIYDKYYVQRPSYGSYGP